MNWGDFSKVVFDSSNETSEWVWGANKLNSVAIPGNLYSEYNKWWFNVPEPEPIELKRKIFNIYGLDGYLERPNCPSMEDLIVNISVRSMTSKSCVT